MEVRYKILFGKSLEKGTAFKDVDTKQGIVQCYIGAFNNVDSGGDILMPGSAAKTISENGPLGKNRIAYLRDHDKSLVMGKPSILNEDNYGIFCETKIIPTSGERGGENTLKLIENNVLTDNSIGYNIVKGEFSKEPGQEDVYLLHEIKLWEGSAVLWGMNENCQMVGVKSNEILIDKLERFTKALHSGNYSDATYLQIEKAAKEIEDILAGKIKPDEPKKEDVTYLQGFLNIKLLQ